MSVSISPVIMLPKEAVMGSFGLGNPPLSPTPGLQGATLPVFNLFFLIDYLHFLDFTAQKVRKWEVAVPTLSKHKCLHLLKNQDSVGRPQHALQPGSSWAAAKVMTAVTLERSLLSGQSQSMFQLFRKACFIDRYPGTRKG